MILKSVYSLYPWASSETTYPTVYQLFPPYCHTGISNSTCSNLKSSSFLPHPNLLLLQHFRIRNMDFFVDSSLSPHAALKQSSSPVNPTPLVGGSHTSIPLPLPLPKSRFLPFLHLSYLKSLMTSCLQNDPHSHLSPNYCQSCLP